VNQYIDPNIDPTTQIKQTLEVGTSSQSQTFAFMPSFAYDPTYSSIFDPYMTPPEVDNM
jgi:hypothetical protein